MKKLLTRLLFAGLACLPQAGIAAPAAQRIVSLDMCSDWLLATHAERGTVAALSPLGHRHAPVQLTDGWPVHDGTLEGILQLQPDLVITGEFNALLLRRRLQALGVRVEVLSLPRSLDDVIAYERRLLDLIGVPADRASRGMAPMGGSSPRKRLLMLGDNGIGTGQGTFENDILERAGWANYLQGDGRIRLDLEKIAADPPDAVLWASPSGNALANRFAQHPVLRRAVPAHRWLATEFWRWECPGPWSWDLIRQLNQWQH